MMGRKRQPSSASYGLVPAASFLAALLLLSCGGGGGGSQPAPGPAPQDLPDVVTNYQYSGRDLGVSGSSGLSQSVGGGYKGFLRLIDPGENIELGVVDGTGRSQVVFPDVQPKPGYLLQFDFTVPGNLLTGEPSGSTQVVLNIPVRVDQGGNTVIDAQLTVPPDLTATLVEASYTMTTPAGTITRRFRVDMATGQVVDDVNNNGTFDDDPPKPDEDRDGLDDEVEHPLGSQEVERDGVQLEQLASDLSSMVAGGETWFISPAFTEIEDERGQKREGLPLSVLAVGQVLKIKGYLNSQGQLIATEIEILSGPFSPDDQPGSGGGGAGSDDGSGTDGSDGGGGSDDGSAGDDDSSDDSSGGSEDGGADDGSGDADDESGSGSGSDDGSGNEGSGGGDDSGSGSGSGVGDDGSGDDGNSGGSGSGGSDSGSGGDDSGGAGSGNDDGSAGDGSSSGSGDGGSASEDDGSGGSSGSGSDDSGSGTSDGGHDDSEDSGSGSGGTSGGSSSDDGSGNSGGDDSSGSGSSSGGSGSSSDDGASSDDESDDDSSGSGSNGSESDDDTDGGSDDGSFSQ